MNGITRGRELKMKIFDSFLAIIDLNSEKGCAEASFNI